MPFFDTLNKMYMLVDVSSFKWWTKEYNISEEHSSEDIFLNEECATQNVLQNVNGFEVIHIWTLLKCANNEKDREIIYWVVEQ